MQPDQARSIFETQKKYFESGATLSYEFRKQQLDKLYKAIVANQEEILAAMMHDLGRGRLDAYRLDLGPALMEIRHMKKHLRHWMQPKRVSSPLLLAPGYGTIYPQPRGVTFHISPWNYPFYLLISSLAGAIAAGCTSIIKPSEFSVATTDAKAKLLESIFPKEYVCVVKGEGASVVPVFLENFQFGHVFYTGSTAVGKKVMEMAARQLSPVTLELGGKSPCIVDNTARVDVAARRIAWAKIINAGQTCVAPDYLLVHEAVRENFMDRLKYYFNKFIPDVYNSDEYAKIINERQYQRLKKYLTDGKIIYGGKTFDDKHVIQPTILEDVPWDSPVMQEEIFGPILPVYYYHENQEALEFMQKHPNPLAFYIFTENNKNKNFFIRNFTFGGGYINDAVAHLSNADLPFGGVGNSGIGAYHGKFSFDTFTHYKSIQRNTTLLDPSIRYHPFSDFKEMIFRKLLR